MSQTTPLVSILEGKEINLTKNKVSVHRHRLYIRRWGPQEEEKKERGRERGTKVCACGVHGCVVQRERERERKRAGVPWPPPFAIFIKP